MEGRSEIPPNVSMTCPHCRAENDAGASRCARCGKGLVGFHAAETLVGNRAPAGAERPEPHPLATTAALATPPPQPTTGTDLWPSAPGLSVTLEPGTEFGPRYRIESLLGRGGMGLVYKALDLDLNRTVALKLIRADLTLNPEALQRFKQELLLSSRISHKNVLRIHDLGEVDGVKFISMAYVEGEDLHRLLRRCGRLPIDRILRLARQLCSALEAAHSEGIVHRDLKPQNVLIDRDENAYISDFGLAKTLEAGAQEMTHTGQILGTPRYMSPEQAQGKTVDARSDLYSLGLMLFEMATGTCPFKGDSFAELMLQRIQEKPKNPKSLNPEVPDYLARVILRCLEADPERRYQSASEIIADLGREQASKPRHSTSLQISLPLPARRRWIYAAVAAALIAALALFLISFRKTRQPHTGIVAAGAGRLPALDRGKYLAVLPFRVLGNQASLGYLAEGLDESLTAKLFSLSGVHMVSSSAVEKEGAAKPISKIAQDLGVNLAVQGSVQAVGREIAIFVRLEDMSSGRLLWIQEFTGVPRDLLTIEDKISNGLIAQLQLHPGAAELARSTAHPTEKFSAYQPYLKGQDLMRGLPDAKTIQTAIDDYQEALKQDPNFALAYAGLANASLQMYQQKKDRFWVEQALTAAQQAEQLSSNLPQVYMALGNVYSATGRSAQAITDLKRAVQLAPGSDEPHRLLGNAYEANGQSELAVAALQRAVAVDPYYWVNSDELGKAYEQAGKYHEAMAQFQRVVQLEPADAAGFFNIGAIYMIEGDYSHAIPSLEKAVKLNPTFGHYSDLGTAYFYARRFTDAVSAFDKAAQLSPNQEMIYGNLAQAYLYAGQKQKATQAFAQAIGLSYKELQVNPRDADTLADMAEYYAMQGEAAQAIQFIHSARSISPGNPQYAYDEAVVEAAARNQPAALASLGEALRGGYPARQAAQDPELSILQGNPDFKKLLSGYSGKPTASTHGN